MNICLFIISGGWGGAENVVYNLATILDKKGHNVSIILNEETYPYFKNLENVNIYNIGSIFDYRKILKTNFGIFIPPRFSELRFFSKGLRFLFGSLLKGLNYRKKKGNVLKIINEINPDVIHFNNPIVLEFYSYIFRHLKCPVIYTAHGKQSRGIKKGNLLESFDKITAVSNHIREYLKTNGISSTINVIYNGLDMNIINALNLRNKNDERLDKKQFILLFPGGMKPNKGGLILLKAMKILDSKNLPIKLYYSGATSTTFVEDNKIKNVKFTGFLPHNEYLKKLNNCDCLILLSLIEEFPISLIEAMALGKTIITTAVGGIPEFCLDRRNALYVKRNPADVAATILHLYKNHKLREKISKNNVQDAERFDWNTIIDKYIELYQSMIH